MAVLTVRGGARTYRLEAHKHGPQNQRICKWGATWHRFVMCLLKEFFHVFVQRCMESPTIYGNLWEYHTI